MGASHEPRSCADVAVVDADPARVEWGYWVLGGAVHRIEPSLWRPTLGLGSELTLGLAQFVGFPAGDGPWGGRAEVRGGLWGAALLRGEAEIFEGGLKLHLGGIYPPRWGTFDLRLGAGTGVRSSNRTVYANVSLLWGIRLVPARETVRSYCAPVTKPKAVAESSVLRLFITGRQAVNAAETNEIALGLEVSPSLLWSGCE